VCGIGPVQGVFEHGACKCAHTVAQPVCSTCMLPSIEQLQVRALIRRCSRNMNMCAQAISVATDSLPRKLMPMP
jgi:hypothetical protein